MRPALAIEHCGEVYSCDHFVYPQNRPGNIMEVLEIPRSGSSMAAS